MKSLNPTQNQENEKREIDLENMSEEDLEYTKNKAKEGNLIAMYVLAQCYHYGYGGIEKDIDKAIEWYTKVAEKGNMEAKFELGKYFYEEKQDYDKAIGYFNEVLACEETDLKKERAKVHVCLGMCYFRKGEYDENKEKKDKEDGNFKQAIKCFENAINLGDNEALYNLAVCYELGKGVEKNINEAIKWYAQAAEKGCMEAKVELGKYFYNVKKDYQTAIEYFNAVANSTEKVVAQKRVEADYYLEANHVKSMNERNADYYTDVERCFTKVRSCKKEELKESLIEAYWYLGVYYYEKGDKEREKKKEENENFKKAVEWYRNAKNLGCNEVIYNLGTCYECGTGVKKDYIKAVECYIIAIGKINDEKAKKRLKNIYLSEENQVDKKMIENKFNEYLIKPESSKCLKEFIFNIIKEKSKQNGTVIKLMPQPSEGVYKKETATSSSLEKSLKMPLLSDF